MSTIARVAAISLLGLEGALVKVEGGVGRQLPGMGIVGLPDTALIEAKQRVRHAAAASGMALTERYVLINLQPADLPKHGSGFDLAIALAALGALQIVPNERLSDVVHIGELGLDGRLRRPRGLLASVAAAVKLGYTTIMVPSEAAEEAVLVPGAHIVAADNLTGAVNWHHGKLNGWFIANLRTQKTKNNVERKGQDEPERVDISDVIGQQQAVYAMQVAAVGRHHVHMQGPPGAGKTMLAARLSSILPELSDDEALTASSLATLSKPITLSSLERRPPFESPHHTASPASIIGSAQAGAVRPGAVSLASYGVLFFDEAQEFPTSILDSLRQPLESGWIDIHRAMIKVRLPAKVQLILASNPCPCGNGGSVKTVGSCKCSPQQLRRYANKLSGPLVDRIDLKINVDRVSNIYKSNHDSDLTSEKLRSLVIEARATALDRYRGTPWRVNADAPGKLLRSKKFHPGKSTTAVLDRALEIGNITLRGYDRTLRIAWSLSDLEGKNSPGREEIARALLLRAGGQVR